MWCAGCGNGIVLNALLCAMDELNLKKEDVLVVTGIGCWGKADDYISANALHTTHGRALTFATGAKAANPNLHVIVLMGDGDGTTIGGNHLIHTARRNMDLTAIIVNNLNYGMLDFLRHRPIDDHASNLGALLAHEIAKPLNIPSYIYDAVVMDQMEDIAKLSGLPEIRRKASCHD